VTRHSGFAACSAEALFVAAYTAEGFDPHDPSYRQLTEEGDGPGAYGRVCYQGWALALISRPNVGTTDGATLFRSTVDGVWREIRGAGGFLQAQCELYAYGVPPGIAAHLDPAQPINLSYAGC